MALMPVAGMKLYIGGVLADQADDFEESDFSAQSWTLIDGWSTCGAYGDSAQVITTSLINRGRDMKQKGTANAGQMQNVFAIIPGDAGQTALLAAAAGSNKNNYAFKVEWPDAATSPASPTPQPTKRYFIALATGAPEQGGEANTINNMQVTLEINSNIVKVAKNP